MLEGFEGVFQIASFHPHYQFAGTHTDDLETVKGFFAPRCPIDKSGIDIKINNHLH